MARVTVEDCVKIIPNRFELVALASQRARDIGAGAVLSVDRDNDKNSVVALREIAKENILPEHLKEALTQSLQVRIRNDVYDQADEEPTQSDIPDEIAALSMGEGGSDFYEEESEEEELDEDDAEDDMDFDDADIDEED